MLRTRILLRLAAEGSIIAGGGLRQSGFRLRGLHMERLMQSLKRVILSAGLALPLLLPIATRADDWPQWRGPHRDGVWSETGILKSFPVDGLKARWRSPVGWGYSSPVVAQGRVYLTDSQVTRPKAQERLHCFDEATGKSLWTHSYEAGYPDWAFTAGQEGRPTATPIVHNGKVYTLGMLGQVFCLDALKGDVLWKKRLDHEYGEVRCNSSPLIEGDLLVLFIGGKPKACVVGLDKNSGKEAWKALDDSVTNSSPIVITVGGKRQLVVWTNEAVTSLDPVTGETRWRERLLTSAEYVVSTPVFRDNRLLIGGLMLNLDPAPSILWPNTKARSRRILSNTSTPVLQGGSVFSAKSSGHLVCLDAHTGNQIWESDKVTDLKNGASIHLTPSGDSVFLYTDKGELSLAKLTSQGYSEISRCRVLEGTYRFGGRMVAWPPPAYANRHIFARNDRELVCVSLAAKP
jgi:outer membrane protein assembly factor BamB